MSWHDAHKSIVDCVSRVVKVGDDEIPDHFIDDEGEPGVEVTNHIVEKIKQLIRKKEKFKWFLDIQGYRSEHDGRIWY